MRGTLISESLMKAMFAPCCLTKPLDGSPIERSIRPVRKNFGHIYENIFIPTCMLLYISFILVKGASARFSFVPNECSAWVCHLVPQSELVFLLRNQIIHEKLFFFSKS